MKTIFKQKITVSFLFLLLTSSAAWSQTAMQQPLPPIPESKVQQTKAHIEGNYTEMNRRQLQGGEIQEAWDNVQKTDGVFNHEWCLDCTFRVRLRQHMVSVIRLPDGEKITAVDVGDPANFKTKVRNSNTIAIKPNGFGGDTNMIVYGEKNRIYPFYLRSEGVNSKIIPDLFFVIDGEVPTDIDIPTDNDKKGSLKAKPLPTSLSEAVKELSPDGYLKTDENDFVEHIPFDPDKLHGWGQYKLRGAEELKPETVFRDDHFTYIRFGEKWNDVELPTAYTVIDGIDELVNTHVKGTTFVIESTNKLISLKSGQKFLCLEFEG